MNDHYIRAAVRTADSGGVASDDAAGTLENIVFPLPGMEVDSGADAEERPVTVAELRRILRSLLSGLRVYVLESDITASQNTARSITEQSKF
jgi:hypothetical protein